MKKVLIIGPISDFGGREVMTNLLVQSLKDVYHVNVLSTILMTKNSVALKSINGNNWNTLSRYLYKQNFFLRASATLTKIVNKRKEPAHFFISNKLTKPFFDFNKLNHKIIQRFIVESDLVIYCDEISGRWLDEIIKITEKYRKPLLTRVTGEIKSIPEFVLKTNTNLNILAHSKQNADILKAHSKIKVFNVDQTTALEKDLLSLEVKENKPLVYGFLGRFSKEKGVLELIKTFEVSDKKIVIAGNGPYLNDVIKACKDNENMSYLGELSPKELCDFYDKIDVFMLTSFEEGGPVVGVEAMAAGKLIVSTKVGAMQERLNQTGNDFWFTHDTPNILKSVINDVEKLSKEERLKIRLQVRKKYNTHNSFNIIKDKYLELADELINN